jgi:hypothetical protein
MMAIYKNSDRRIWCDPCKVRYGKLKDGTWHHRAQVMAVWITVSETINKGFRRGYCQPCANEYQTWHDNTIWTFKEMQEYAKGMRQLDGMESR